MIHPNRTYLLQLRKKQKAVSGSLNILKARRQALLEEFLNSIKPFLSSRKQVKNQYYNALQELYRSMGEDGQQRVISIAMNNPREGALSIQKKNILGVKYYDVVLPGNIHREVDARNYDISASSGHLEEAADLFEKTVESLFFLAGFEIKIRSLGEEILRVSRRVRVLEERILPGLVRKIIACEQYISEREREEYFRLKKFKNTRLIEKR